MQTTTDISQICWRAGCHITSYVEANPEKSQAVVISNGILVDDSLQVSNGNEIVGVKPSERVKSLECSFDSELEFDNYYLENLNKNLNKL